MVKCWRHQLAILRKNVFGLNIFYLINYFYIGTISKKQDLTVSRKAYFGHFLIQFDFTIFENGMRSLNTFNR